MLALHLDRVRQSVWHETTLGVGTSEGVVSRGAYTDSVADPGVHQPTRGLRLGSRAVLVPIKAFDEAKRRLDHALTAPERSELARAMAARVLDAAHPLPVAVVCDDNDVADWARERGALVVWEPGRGLNGAVEAGVDHLRDAGVTQVTVSHADLPRASGLATVGDASGITLVPDRYGNGTNVIALPVDTGFRFSYGPGSFAAPLRRGGAPRAAAARSRLARSGLGHRRARRHGAGDRPGDDRLVTAGAGPPGPSDRPPGSGLPVGDLLDTSTVTVDLDVPATALAIGAHPDDVEFGAGATLAKWAAAGCRVHHLVLTDGSKGSWDPDEDLGRLVADRMQECRSAAARIDGDPGRTVDPPHRVDFVGRLDGELDNDAATRREVARTIRLVRPDVVLGHDPWRRYRLHPDHRAAGFLTVDAIVAARDPHFFGDLDLEPHRPSSLLLWEADQPNHVERVGGFAETKVDALLCHHSQLVTTMGVGPAEDRGGGPGPEVSGDGRAVLAARVGWQLAQHGALAGIGAGEAFHLMVGL